MLTWSQAGLFSAVTSAFIIDIQSQLQSDPNDETAALLRVLIYKTDNTAFGNDVPTLPRWTGPPNVIVQVQALLYASLAASLLSALVVMLGRQWLKRYAMTDLRGTTIERCHNRQRKLDGIISWHFDLAMDSLPLVLQVALLLLCAALARYLWEVNIAVASVLIGVVLCTVIIYIFIITAGATSETCPYQTPGSIALRHLWLKTHRVLRHLWLKTYRVLRLGASIVRSAFLGTETGRAIATNVRAFAIDTRRLWRETIRTLPDGARHLASMMVVLLADRLRGAPSPPEHAMDLYTIALDFRCISWMLQTSLDKAIHLTTFKHLAEMKTLAGCNIALVAGCFDTFISCMKGGVAKREIVVVQGFEELAAVSALCFFNTFSHLLAVDPTSGIVEDTRWRFLGIFSPETDFQGQYHTMKIVCRLLLPQWALEDHWSLHSWKDYKPSTHEHGIIAHGLARFARFTYQRSRKAKVPRWIIHFAFNSLSQNSSPPIPVIADCLTIIAIDLGCDVPYTGTVVSDERCV